jgi:hypothetical protein
MKHCLVVTAIILLIAGPALSAEYYVYQYKKCKVTDKRPSGYKVMMGTKSYATEQEAEAAIKTLPECQTTTSTPQ